jgi:hypothetical protein
MIGHITCIIYYVTNCIVLIKHLGVYPEESRVTHLYVYANGGSISTTEKVIGIKVAE